MAHLKYEIEVSMRMRPAWPVRLLRWCLQRLARRPAPRVVHFEITLETRESPSRIAREVARRVSEMHRHPTH